MSRCRNRGNRSYRYEEGSGRGSTALGYSGADALRAVKKVELTPDMSVEILLKLALKNMF